MSKKQKRRVAAAEVAPATATTAAAGTPRAAASSSRPALTTEFKPDYSPVIRDLKKIGIMAASFISLLVILSFFLR